MPEHRYVAYGIQCPIFEVKRTDAFDGWLLLCGYQESARDVEGIELTG